LIRSTVRELADQVTVRPSPVSSIKSAIRVETDVTLSAFFQCMRAYFAGREKPSEPLLRLKLKELVVSILTGGGNPGLAAYFHSVAGSEAVSVAEIMEVNFRFNLSLDEYAALCHRSLSSFKRDFRQHFQEPPGKWLIRKRLEYAAALLHSTKLSVTEVVFESGFEDVSHFSRAFKERFSSSPSAYRQAAPAAK
jgi:AraC-like DNA-binding protein